MSRMLKVYLILLAGWIILGLLGVSWLQWLKDLFRFGFFILTVYYAFRLTGKFVRSFLWRIRRKLILSYIFIGVVPIILVFIIVMFGFYIFMGQATSEMFQAALDSYVLQTRMEGEKLIHLTEAMEPDKAIDRWFSELDTKDQDWLKYAEITAFTNKQPVALKGELTPMPDWIGSKDFSGITTFKDTLWLTAVRRQPTGDRALLIRVPVSGALLSLIRDTIQADINYVSDKGVGVRDEFDVTVGRKGPIWPVWWDLPVAWLSLPDQYHWESGKRVSLISTDDERPGHINLRLNEEGPDADIGIREDSKDERDGSIGAFAVNTNVSRVFNHIFSRSTALQKAVYVAMAAVGGVFLVIELLSLIFGLLLARSITASVHSLFEGTRRIQSGDLNYKIKVHAKDQLGELAVSFNSMTDSIKNLLVVQAEKERLSEALRIARQMQENLLPREIYSGESFEIAAMNLAAQEVCGDYYDIIRRTDQETGIVVADVSGKGPSAALYMAEVKGVMLSVSRRTILPREALVEANMILSPTLDPRTFITMTYAMIDETSLMMKLSRAGHNPVLHYVAGSGNVDVLQPRGIGLGLSKNGIFENSLEEVERKLAPGDVLVFYTDGLTEAMNSRNELYGLERVTSIVLKNKDLSAEQIKSCIHRDLDQFLNGIVPQDDVTLVLLKVR